MALYQANIFANDYNDRKLHAIITNVFHQVLLRYQGDLWKHMMHFRLIKERPDDAMIRINSLCDDTTFQVATKVVDQIIMRRPAVESNKAWMG